jgi:hypothetical protein
MSVSLVDIVVVILKPTCFYGLSPSGLTYDSSEKGVPLHQRTWETSDTSVVRPWLEALFTPLVQWRYDMEKQSRRNGIITPSDIPTLAGKKRKLSEAGIVDEDEPGSSPQPSPPSSSTDASSIDPLFLRGATSWLNDYCSKKKIKLEFVDENAGGLPHAPWHSAEVFIEGEKMGTATCRTKKDARNEASARARQKLAI